MSLRFWRRRIEQQREVELDNAAFRRWLRAGRPPFVWFLEQDAETQEQLALLGDAQERDRCVGIGYAVRNPEAAAVGLSAGGERDDEASMVARLAAEALAKMRQQTAARAASAPVSMAGVVGHAQAAAATRKAAEHASRSWLGEPPDEVRA